MDLRPEHLLDTLDDPVSDAAAASPAPARHGPGPADRHEAVLASISSCYFRLRRGLALIALLFPLVLWLRAGELRTSISAYYHAPADGFFPSTRDLFVGVLCAVGAFLYFYKGYSRREMIALNAGGLAAIVIGLVPVDYPYNPDGWPSAVGLTHNVASLIFFVAIAYVCLARSRDTLSLVEDPERRARFASVYSVLGTLMIAAPATATILHLLIPRAADEAYWVLAIEVAGIWVFAAFWLVKSREIRALEAQRRRRG